MFITGKLFQCPALCRRGVGKRKMVNGRSTVEIILPLPRLEPVVTDMRKLLFALLLSCSLIAAAQTANPQMTYVDTLGLTQNITEYDGSAPFKASFTSNISDADDYTPLYEWRFMRVGDTEPFLVRYEADTEFEFTQTGTFTVQLLISFVQGGDTILYEQEEPFAVNIRESILEFPNAFTPNGDGINDTFSAKSGWQSIVSFHAMIFSRSGKLLYEWHDPAGSWDGRSGGKVVPDGAYYLRVDAKGADGRTFNIRKVINILTGYRETSD